MKMAYKTKQWEYGDNDPADPEQNWDEEDE